LGREGSADSTATSTPTEAPKTSELSQSKSAQVHEIFMEILQSVDKGLTGEQLGDLLEDKRDKLPPGPTLHQILAFAKEMKENPKMIVGSTRDEVVNKLKDFKSKYD
ncbi:MAG: hypothetical protein ACFFAO_06015, partial [Candidatus Hermodarchaeota archaeon]